MKLQEYRKIISLMQSGTSYIPNVKKPYNNLQSNPLGKLMTYWPQITFFTLCLIIKSLNNCNLRSSESSPLYNLCMGEL